MRRAITLPLLALALVVSQRSPAHADPSAMARMNMYAANARRLTAARAVRKGLMRPPRWPWQREAAPVARPQATAGAPSEATAGAPSEASPTPARAQARRSRAPGRPIDATAGPEPTGAAPPAQPSRPGGAAAQERAARLARALGSWSALPQPSSHRR